MRLSDTTDSNIRRLRFVTALLLFVVSLTGSGWAADTGAATRAGDIRVEPSTLTSLGLEWAIEGDSNRNSSVAIAYRAKGSAPWLTGLPLFRLQNEQILTQPFRFTTPNMFAGSVFDLTPDTAYEVKLSLTDPDGVRGKREQRVEVRTRREPRPATDGRVFHVYPPDFKGTKQTPAFTGLLAAYYTGSAHADWSNTFPVRVRPGDTIQVHAGVYKDNRYNYGGGLGTVFDGTYHLTAKGTAERPITIRSAGDGEVIFDGDGNFNLFDVIAADHNYFAGITVRNTDIAFLAGIRSIAGASGLTVRYSKFEDVGVAVTTEYAGSRDFYIADNTMIGRHDQQRLVGWIGRTWQGIAGFPAPVRSNYAIKVYGQGHVIAYNAISHFHDGVSHATYGVPDLAADRAPVSIDIYNNDIFNSADNCIEVDGGLHNIRVMRNRCFNHAHRALSAQPLFGGPAYFIRNIVYNSPEGGSLKLHATPSGVLLYHNTLIGEVHEMGPASNVHFRNNLILGQGAFDEIFNVDTLTNYSSSDYNGFRVNPGKARAFAWNSPPFSMPADFAIPASPNADDEVAPPAGRGAPLPTLEERRYATLAEYSRGTNQDIHSKLVDYDVMQRVSPPQAGNPTRLYQPADYDFGLTSDSVAIDAGVVLPNINDGYAGTAPDLGALELNAAPPHYGPRPR